MGNNARGEANDMFAILMGANLGETFFFGAAMFFIHFHLAELENRGIHHYLSLRERFHAVRLRSNWYSRHLS